MADEKNVELRNYQHDSRVDATHHSAGFGLWFVHLVVIRSGGSLHLDRGDERGNVVTIELPTQLTVWLN